MPTYEYRCRDCGDHLEVVQSFTEDALTECPACRGSLKKVFHPIGIAFKGSGFYKTDSRSTASTTSSGGGDGGTGGDSGDAEKAGGEPGKDSSSASSGETSGAKDAKSSTKKSA